VDRTLRFLVLGGTAWLGGTVAARALAEGHHVTCLARGVSGTVPEGAEVVTADRWQPGAYDAVAGQDWDVVLDVSWEPALVRSALTALAPRARHWVYVSSISVYADHSVPGADESAELLPAWIGEGTAPAEVYGEAKVSCETACREILGSEQLLVARAGLIVGHGDRSDRFGYWPARFARASAGEQVLVPPLDAPAQFIDVEDLAGWLVAAGAQGVSGVYDATGPRRSIGEVVSACLAATAPDTASQPRLVDPGEPWLLAEGVAPWMGPESLPLWVPSEDYAGHNTRTVEAVHAAGLTTRPLEETVRDALRWETELGLDRERRSGLTPPREASLLARLSHAGM
jgi:nucleoside-diphosphate-sugar epimerase